LPHRSSSLASLHQCSLEQQKEDENKKNENEERLFIDYRLEIKLQKNKKKESFFPHTYIFNTTSRTKKIGSIPKNEPN